MSLTGLNQGVSKAGGWWVCVQGVGMGGGEAFLVKAPGENLLLASSSL